MADSSTSPSPRIIFGALTIVFITLKLCGVIDWSWWLVLAPLWIVLAVVLTLAAIFVICRRR